MRKTTILWLLIIIFSVGSALIVFSNTTKQNKKVCYFEREKADQAMGEFLKFTIVYEKGVQKFRLLNGKELVKAIKKFEVMIDYVNCLNMKIKKKAN